MQVPTPRVLLVLLQGACAGTAAMLALGPLKDEYEHAHPHVEDERAEWSSTVLLNVAATLLLLSAVALEPNVQALLLGGGSWLVPLPLWLGHESKKEDEPAMIVALYIGDELCVFFFETERLFGT